MRFLIIEDDNYKAKQVEDCIKGHEIVRAISYNTGVRTLLDKEDGQFDGVILDMGLPCFDDGSSYREDRGMVILMEMRRKRMNIPVLIHSGNTFDVSEFKNVHSYILANAFVDISKKVQDFVDFAESQREKDEVTSFDLNVQVNGFYCIDSDTNETVKEHLVTSLERIKGEIEVALGAEIRIEPTDVLDSMGGSSYVGSDGVRFFPYDAHFILHAVIKETASDKDSAVELLSQKLKVKSASIENTLMVGMWIGVEGQEV